MPTFASFGLFAALSKVFATNDDKIKLHSLELTNILYSVVDPKLFIPDPDLALNFLSSRSGSRQKLRIHADPDPDPTCIYNLK